MKKIACLALALALCECFALAEDNGIAGSDANALVAKLEVFGIPAPVEVRTVDGFTWESDTTEVHGVSCSYTLNANEQGEIVSGTFRMDEKDNGLFKAVAEVEYDEANPSWAKQFVSSNMDKAESSLIIGDAEFAVSALTSISTASITIGSWSRSSTSKSTDYVMHLDYVSEDTPRETIAMVTKGVNIRAKDTSDSDKVGHAAAGDELVVTQPYYSEKWHQIEYEGQTAYVSANYCELVTRRK